MNELNDEFIGITMTELMDEALELLTRLDAAATHVEKQEEKTGVAFLRLEDEETSRDYFINAATLLKLQFLLKKGKLIVKQWKRNQTLDY